MFSIVITEKGGAQRQLDFEGSEIGIGRLEENDLCLPKNNVSKFHARLVYKDDRYVLLDQKSTNGTYVNGRRIAAPMVVRKGDKIYIGDFILTIAAPGGTESVAAKEFRPANPSVDMRAATLPTRTLDVGPPAPDRPLTPLPRNSSPPPPPSQPHAQIRLSSSVPPPLPRSSSVPPPVPVTEPSIPPPSAASEPPPRAATPTRAPPPRFAAKDTPTATDNAQAAAAAGLTSPAVLPPSVRLQGALAMLMERLATQMNVARNEESAFPSERQPVLERLLDELAEEGALGPDIDRRYLRDAAVSEAVGLGPLDRLLANRAVREIVVDGPTRVLADLGAGLAPVSSFFSDDSAVLVVARRLLHRAGLKLDQRQLAHDVTLPGGAALQLLLPPLATKGALITIRCAPRATPSPETLVSDGLLSNEMLDLLRVCIKQRVNILVLGPLGVGVSSLLAALAAFAPEHERVVTIESGPSASLHNPQAIALSRSALPQASLDDFLRRAAQLRYDRLVIDDVRPIEALAALTTAAGTRGVLLGMHAPTSAVALTLLESLTGHELVGTSGPLVAAALQVLVQLGPDAAGNVRISSISELRSGELEPLFDHDGTSFRALNPSPSFLEA